MSVKSERWLILRTLIKKFQTAFIRGGAEVNLTLIAATMVLFSAFGVVSPHVNAQSSGHTVVSISVDGERQTFSTGAGTVAEVLKRAEVSLIPEDLVEPAIDTPIDSQVFNINIYRAKPAIVVDGEDEIKVNTPYQNPRLVAEKSAGLEVFPEDEYRTELIQDFIAEETIGYRVIIERARPVKLVVSGKALAIRTQAETVAEVLAEKGIELADDDIVKPALKTPVVAGMMVAVTRVGQEIVAKEETIKREVEIIYNNDQPVGWEEVREEGRDGKKLVTYQITYHNGKEVSRQEVETVEVSKAVKEVVVRGVKQEVISEGGAGGDWYRLRMCESGGNYATNTGNGYYGAYQFDHSTWQSYGGSGYPHENPPAVQDEIARRLHAARGWQPWPACRAKLGLP